MKIGMIGTGYVGLVAGVCFADSGHEVTCVDHNGEKISKLREGQVPFYEPGLEDLFQRNKKRMRFSAEIKDAVEKSEVIFLAVGTPEMADGSTDLEPTFNALREICAAATHDFTLVLKSTVPVGTAKRVRGFIKEHSQRNIEVVSNPEFLRQGEALEDFLNPDRVVVGVDSEKSRQVMTSIYKPFTDRSQSELIFMDNTSAELTKYAANSFLALKISFINEMALLADKLGADIDSVREGFTSDHRINPSFFFPGIGYGGSCFPKDVRSLIETGKDEGVDMLVLQAANAVNERQKTILVERLRSRFENLNGLHVGVWGLAFKPRTDDVRRAPAVELIETLHREGVLVHAYDPVATNNAVRALGDKFTAAPSLEDAARGMDALLIVTEWPEFRSADLESLKRSMRTPVILDGRNIFDPAQMHRLGFEYQGIGKSVRR